MPEKGASRVDTPLVEISGHYMDLKPDTVQPIQSRRVSIKVWLARISHTFRDAA